MDQKTRNLLIWNEVMFSFLMAVTSPTIHIYFVIKISPTIYSLANVLGTMFAAMTNVILKTNNRRKIFRKYLYVVMIVDVILTAIISSLGFVDANIRFLGMGFVESITVVIWYTIITEAINENLHSEGLTNYQVAKKSYCLWATGIGSMISVLICYYGIDFIYEAVIIQCIGNLIFAFGDYVAYKRLRGEK